MIIHCINTRVAHIICMWSVAISKQIHITNIISATYRLFCVPELDVSAALTLANAKGRQLL